jgi:hypothetical protein
MCHAPTGGFNFNHLLFWLLLLLLLSFCDNAIRHNSKKLKKNTIRTEQLLLLFQDYSKVL